MKQTSLHIGKQRFAKTFSETLKNEGQWLAREMGMSFSSLISMALVEFIKKYKK